jgi:hypothetical protein
MLRAEVQSGRRCGRIATSPAPPPRCMHRRMVETDAAEAEASLAALLDEEASKLRILQVALQRGVDAW